ncbi:ubiA prenyltransferase family protein [Lyngbya aestuarii BL J]|uniref:UbiA prenyltransferase family protein n=1 Tax=Lyngbya aestuarii BL J TaxID=1348334 RepID=U7QJE2_9CYAN|nr:UbiA family prenyltransferase [Lyngbya aestuarii]ERT08003.1 ubiA prenyltransferase family protein [Lyngbya aestuarii BL J]
MFFENQSVQKLSQLGKDFYEQFLSLIVYSNLWVAGGIASLVFFVQTALNLSIDWHPAVFLFAAALIPYNLDRIVDSYVQKSLDSKEQYFVRKPGSLLLVSAAILTFVFLLYSAPSSVQRVSWGGLLPLSYGVPLFPFQQQGNLNWYRPKDIPGIKAWIVCGVITYALIAVPLAYAGVSFNYFTALVTFFLLIFVGTNSHLFDIRDIDSDREKGVRTLPLIIGIRGTRIFWTGLNLILLLLAGWTWTQQIWILSPVVVIPCILLNLIAIWTVTPQTPRNIYNLVLDGYLFLPGLLTLILGLMTSNL